MEEIWKDILGYEGMYQASSFGRVRSLDRTRLTRGVVCKIKGKVISPNINNSGYYYITLCKDGIHHCLKVHRLVAMTFIENPKNLPEVNHKDGNKLNNCIDNLEWCTHSENHKHLYKMGKCNIDEEHKKRQRKILQFDVKTGALIKEWSSIIEAERSLNKTNPNACNIWHCLNGYNQTAYGYNWKYK